MPIKSRGWKERPIDIGERRLSSSPPSPPLSLAYSDSLSLSPEEEEGWKVVVVVVDGRERRRVAQTGKWELWAGLICKDWIRAVADTRGWRRRMGGGEATKGVEGVGRGGGVAPLGLRPSDVDGASISLPPPPYRLASHPPTTSGVSSLQDTRG